jgi:hypothetical protein
MAWSTTALKRQRELSRLDRQRKKAERRAQRRSESALRRQGVPQGEDPDLAGIVPGPQPAAMA